MSSLLLDGGDGGLPRHRGRRGQGELVRRKKNCLVGLMVVGEVSVFSEVERRKK